MVLGFNPRFVPKILDGTKIHTIRQDPKDRWFEGRKMQQATGVRTKNYKCFSEKVCTGVQTIEIIYSKDFVANLEKADVAIDKFYLDREEIIKLAINDGFDSLSDFLEWFNQDFKGKIIHWTDLRY